MVELGETDNYHTLEYERKFDDSSAYGSKKGVFESVKVLSSVGPNFEFYFEVEALPSSELSLNQKFFHFENLHDFLQSEESQIVKQSYGDYSVENSVYFCLREGGNTVYLKCVGISSVTHFRDSSFKLKVVDGWEYMYRVGDPVEEKPSVQTAPYSHQPKLVGIQYVNCHFLFEWSITYQYPLFLKYVKGVGVLEFNDPRPSGHKYNLVKIDGKSKEDFLREECN